MAFCEKTKTPSPNENQEVFFKIPPVPRKIDTSRLALSKIQVFSTNPSSSDFSPCVRLGQKRPTFPFSPAFSTPTSSTPGNSRFFCEDDWLAWKNGIENYAVCTSIGPRPPTPPTWVATPHRSGLHRRANQTAKSEHGLRRRLLTLRSASEERTKTGQILSNGLQNEKNLGDVDPPTPSCK